MGAQESAPRALLRHELALCRTHPLTRELCQSFVAKSGSVLAQRLEEHLFGCGLLRDQVAFDTQSCEGHALLLLSSLYLRLHREPLGFLCEEGFFFK